MSFSFYVADIVLNEEMKRFYCDIEIKLQLNRICIYYTDILPWFWLFL